MIKTPYLLFIGDEHNELLVKTASGIRYWRPDLAKGQLRFSGNPVDLGVPDYDVEGAVAAGLKTIVIGVAPSGGVLPETWLQTLVEALEAGLDIASGLHVRLNEIPELKEAATRCSRQIFDVRFPTGSIPVGNGAVRPGKRLLTVGTECAVGKMYTTLAIEKEFRARGVKADFRATGQTGILIAGDGISVDAVVSDFVSGAAEILSPPNEPDHWDIIEGQGSLFHPSFAGVSLGLLHGSQPDAIVVCHDASRTHIIEMEAYPVPSLTECIETNLQLGRLTNPEIRCVGAGINTSSLSGEDALQYLARMEDETGVPCVDPVRTGVAKIVDGLI